MGGSSAKLVDWIIVDAKATEKVADAADPELKAWAMDEDFRRELEEKLDAHDECKFGWRNYKQVKKKKSAKKDDIYRKSDPKSDEPKTQAFLDAWKHIRAEEEAVRRPAALKRRRHFVIGQR